MIYNASKPLILVFANHKLFERRLYVCATYIDQWFTFFLWVCNLWELVKLFAISTIEPEQVRGRGCVSLRAGR